MPERTWLWRTPVENEQWGPGPWDSEPDKLTWMDEATGLDCMALRNRYGAWCGYVGLPPEHSLHGTDYDDVQCRLPDLLVHGGLTFADRCDETGVRPMSQRICHVPEPGRPADVWWLGFDCAHAWDLVPGLKATGRIVQESEPIYRLPWGLVEYCDVAFVRAEVVRLAAQLAAPHPPSST